MPATIAAKNGSPEEAVRVFRHDQGDRVRLPRGEGARRAVGHVVQLVDRGAHRGERLRAHRRRPVHDPRHGRPGDTGCRGHLFDGRSWRHQRTHSSIALFSPTFALRIRAHGPIRAPDGTIHPIRTPLRLERAGRDDARVLPTGVLEAPLLGVVIDAHDAEALVVTPGPFVVVEHRPVEVAPHVDTRLRGIEHRTQVQGAGTPSGRRRARASRRLRPPRRRRRRPPFSVMYSTVPAGSAYSLQTRCSTRVRPSGCTSQFCAVRGSPRSTEWMPSLDG